MFRTWTAYKPGFMHQKFSEEEAVSKKCSGKKKRAKQSMARYTVDRLGPRDDKAMMRSLIVF